MSVRCIEMLGLMGGNGRIGLYRATADRLTNIETLELRVPEIERLVLSGILMRSTKGFGSGPCLESGTALPKRVGCVQGRAFGLGPFQQMELQEPRYAVQMSVTPKPDLFEITFTPLDHWKRFMAINIGSTLARHAATGTFCMNSTRNNRAKDDWSAPYTCVGAVLKMSLT